MAPSNLIEVAGEPVGPHPSYIEIAKPYIFEHRIRDCLNSAGVPEAKDDSIRLQGVAWIDSVRKALFLPVRTYNTACVYYHKFRLMHPDGNGYIDAAAAALFGACKIEDTLKKSKEILCAAYNMKLSPAEQLTPDDSVFEAHSKTIIGLERLMLEASGFDFRNRYPQPLTLKLAKLYNVHPFTVGKIAYSMTLDMYRTYAPLKQTTATMAFACIELAARVCEQSIVELESGKYDKRWRITRQEVMETLLDLLDLYTHHRASTIVGHDFPLETFISIRIALNQEASTNKYPRYTMTKPKPPPTGPNANGSSTTNNKSTNGTNNKNTPATPTSPRGGRTKEVLVASPQSANGAGGKPGLKEGTVRFMLDPQRARDEKDAVKAFFRVEEEEYEVEVTRGENPRESRRS